MFGFLNVYKPAGMTSHDVVAVMRRLTKIKQIGHTGTLDPFAEGVLPICIGKATKLIEYLDDDKAYVGTVQLGKSTTTYDTEGEIVNIDDRKVSLMDIESILPLYRGNILQTPPIYSAIKVNGKKLYDYARNGEQVEINPRSVTINQLRILNFNIETNELELFIECSKGTYIRSLANDIGESLGTHGFLSKLVRVKAGNFAVKDSIQLNSLKTADDVMKNLINPVKYLNYPRYEVNEIEYKKVLYGNAIETNLNDGIVIITSSEKIIAVASVKNCILKPQKVFI